MYISVPLVLYVGERTLRAFRSKAYAVKILKVTESSKSSSSISLSACQAPVGTLTDKKNDHPIIVSWSKRQAAYDMHPGACADLV